MKNQLIVIILLTPTLFYGQWKYGSDTNKFDGKYKYASVTGTGGEFPYTKPSFNLNQFENSTPNIYLSSIGYTGCGNAYISFAFDGREDSIEFNSGTNSDNDAAFVSIRPKEYSKLLELMDFFNEGVTSKVKIILLYKSNLSIKNNRILRFPVCFIEFLFLF